METISTAQATTVCAIIDAVIDDITGADWSKGTQKYFHVWRNISNTKEKSTSTSIIKNFI
jgi:hypothetical protein